MFVLQLLRLEERLELVEADPTIAVDVQELEQQVALRPCDVEAEAAEWFLNVNI